MHRQVQERETVAERNAQKPRGPRRSLLDIDVSLHPGDFDGPKGWANREEVIAMILFLTAQVGVPQGTLSVHCQFTTFPPLLQSLIKGDSYIDHK